MKQPRRYLACGCAIRADGSCCYNDLLAACKAAAEALESVERKHPDAWTWVDPVLAQITAAIAKAEEAQS